jgi:predicted nuclease of restriction endonuclease-like (RecB) superfamily
LCKPATLRLGFVLAGARCNYWDIGRGIVEKQQTAGWGDAVVERLAADLRAEFPDMRGFSANNLWLMRQLYSEYSTAPFLERLVQEIPPARSFHRITP